MKKWSCGDVLVQKYVRVPSTATSRRRPASANCRKILQTLACEICSRQCDASLKRASALRCRCPFANINHPSDRRCRVDRKPAACNRLRTSRNTHLVEALTIRGTPRMSSSDEESPRAGCANLTSPDDARARSFISLTTKDIKVGRYGTRPDHRTGITHQVTTILRGWAFSAFGSIKVITPSFSSALMPLCLILLES